MKNYDFSDIEIGLEESFVYELTEEKMQKFLEITGDINPLHNDINYAKEKGYNERVVYGMLTASALSTLAGVYLPGKKSLIHSIDLSFVKPVFILNCPLKVSGKVINKDDRFKQIEIKCQVLDKTDTKVLKANMKVGFID